MMFSRTLPRTGSATELRHARLTHRKPLVCSHKGESEDCDSPTHRVTHGMALFSGVRVSRGESGTRRIPPSGCGAPWCSRSRTAPAPAPVRHGVRGVPPPREGYPRRVLQRTSTSSSSSPSPATAAPTTRPAWKARKLPPPPSPLTLRRIRERLGRARRDLGELAARLRPFDPRRALDAAAWLEEDASRRRRLHLAAASALFDGRPLGGGSPRTMQSPCASITWKRSSPPSTPARTAPTGAWWRSSPRSRRSPAG